MSDQLAQAIAQVGDDNALRDVLAEVRKLTGMRFAAIAYVSDDRWIASQVDDDLGFGLAAGDELDVHRTICKEVRCNSREILIDDTETDPLWSAHAVPQHYGIRSYVSVPVFVGGSFFGTLCAIDTEPRHTPLAEMRDQLLALAAEASGRLMERMHTDLMFRGRGLPA